MKKWLLLAVAAAAVCRAEPQRIVLLQELVRLNAMERKTLLIFPLEQQGAQVDVIFASQRGGEGVRMAVYEKGSTNALGSSAYEVNGAMRTALTKDHEYRIEIENLRQRLGHALVDVEVALVFGGRPVPLPPADTQALDPRRRLITIIASLSIFALLCVYSAVRLTPPIVARLRQRE